MARILLIDDDHDILKFGQTVLSHAQHDVFTAAGALEAMDLLGTIPFDLVISDANMPKFSGFDVVKTLRSRAEYSSMGVALFTSRREKKDVEFALKLGVDDYIVKPIDPASLIQKVNALLIKKPPREKLEIAPQEMNIPNDLQVTSSTKIEIFSEIGLTLKSANTFSLQQTLRCQFPVFEELGMECPLLKVIGCQQMSEDRWIIRTLFVGINEQQILKIRTWIQQQQQKKNRQSA